MTAMLQQLTAFSSKEIENRESSLCSSLSRRKSDSTRLFRLHRCHPLRNRCQEPSALQLRTERRLRVHRCNLEDPAFRRVEHRLSDPLRVPIMPAINAVQLLVPILSPKTEGLNDA
jgi:hypothetical protein